MKKNYTPGPYTVQWPGYDGKQFKIYKIYDTGAKMLIASLPQRNGCMCYEDKANVLLFNAAPLMVDALLHAMTAMHQNMMTIEERRALWQEMQDALKAAGVADDDGGDDEVKDPQFLQKEDVLRLKHDELVFIVRSFWDWYNDKECPVERCDDYFCSYCKGVKEDADKKLADGEMLPDDYNHLAKNGFYDGFCCGTHNGCWPAYYLWCYRNNYDPETGKKMEATDDGC